MIYLILAILCSASISTIMRFADAKVSNRKGMFAANYAMCVAAALLFTNRDTVDFSSSGNLSAIMLGLIGGVLYLASFMVLQWNIRQNGVILSSTFMKLGVLIPTVMAILIFGEKPNACQILAIIGSVAAIILMNYTAEGKGMNGKRIFLVLLLITGGLADAMTNIYDKTCDARFKESFLLFTFLAALILSVILAVFEKKPIGLKDILFGCAIGIPNYFSSRFMLLALSNMPAVVAYPMFSVGSILLLSLVGVMIFSEHLKKREIVAMGIILVSLTLINL